MTFEKAVEVIKTVLATKNKKKEVIVHDMLQLSIACTIVSQYLSEKEIKKLLQ
jgi:hypothetical protein